MFQETEDRIGRRSSLLNFRNPANVVWRHYILPLSPILCVSVLISFAASAAWFGISNVEAVSIVSVVNPTCQLFALPGEQVSARFSLENHSDAPVRIVGAQTVCGCVALPNFPLTAAPQSAVELEFRIIAWDLEMDVPVTHRIELFVEGIDQKPVLLVELRRKP